MTFWGHCSSNFPGVSLGKARHMPGKFYDGHLHPQTDPQKRDVVFSGIADGADHSLDSPAAKSAGDQDPVYLGQDRGGIFPGSKSRSQSTGYTPWRCWHNRRGPGLPLQIGRRRGAAHISQPVQWSLDGGGSESVLTSSSHSLRSGGGVSSPSSRQTTSEKWECFQHQRRLVQVGQSDILYDTVRFYIAKQGNFLENRGLQRPVTPQDDDIG